jgi:hypothetical protein
MLCLSFVFVECKFNVAQSLSIMLFFYLFITCYIQSALSNLISLLVLLAGDTNTNRGKFGTGT